MGMGGGNIRGGLPPVPGQRPAYGGNPNQPQMRVGQAMGGKGGGMGRPMSPELPQMTDAMTNNTGQTMQVPPQMQNTYADLIRAQLMPQVQGVNGYQGSQSASGMIDRRTPEIRAAQEAYRRANPQQASPLAGLASLSGIYRGMR